MAQNNSHSELKEFDTEYSRSKRELWNELPIGGHHSILPKIEENLVKTKNLIEKLSLEIETITDEDLKIQKKLFLDKLKNYLNILERVIFDLKQYSKNIFSIIHEMDEDHPNYKDIEIASSYMEPLLIALSPIFMKFKFIEYELNENLSNNEKNGNSQVYESTFLHNGGKFFSRMLLRNQEYNNTTTGKSGEVRIKTDLYDFEDGIKILSARIDLSKENNIEDYSVYFDFEFPNSSYIDKYLPKLSNRIVKGTQNCHTHHSFLLKLSKEEFGDFIDLCEYIISKDQ